MSIYVLAIVGMIRLAKFDLLSTGYRTLLAGTCEMVYFHPLDILRNSNSRDQDQKEQCFCTTKLC